MRMSPETEESVRCTSSGCSCLCFRPGSVQVRSCDRCGHGWVPHALAKLHFQAQPPSGRGPVEVALPGLVFDLSSLVLYGAQAVPVRLKILLDRLYSVLTPEQVGHILHTLGWTLGDYVRGYMLQYPNGKVLDRWLTVTPEEELLILRQFLRFGETRPIVELMNPQYLAGVSQRSDPDQNPDLNPDLKDFNQSGPPGVFRNIRGDSVCCWKTTSPADVETVPGGPSLLLPFHFPSSALHCLAPPTKELHPPGKLTQCLRKLSGAKMAESHRQEVVRQEESELYLGFKIKADPDKLNPDQHLDPDLQGTTTKQENSSLIPKSSQTSYSLNPLPSFSSSFLCPLPAPSFSPSLHPISSSSSSLCSFPPLSPAGGRKGRVCCAVCGKSFYDKGTLKIHYNAVHLKIKHRCTVAGCAMVFSSLRSRNRHSANPNPRLHTSSGRNSSLQSETQTDKSARRNRVTAHIDPQHGRRDDTPPHADSPPPSPCPLPRTLNQNQDCDRPDLQAPPPLLPARSAPSLGPPPSFVPLQLPEHFLNRQLSLHSNHVVPTPLPDPITVATNGNHDVTEGKQKEAYVSPATNQRRRWQSGDPMPKKKPRKSSMPVKIERERNSGCNDTHS